jgi:hypothetical protein
LNFTADRLGETTSFDLRYLDGLFDPKPGQSVKSADSVRGGGNPKIRRKQYSQHLKNELEELNRYLNLDFKTNHGSIQFDDFSAKDVSYLGRTPPKKKKRPAPLRSVSKGGRVGNSLK